MNIKPIVNNQEHWGAFKEYLEENMLKVAYKKLKQESDPKVIYRLQGEIKILDRLINLRDEVNVINLRDEVNGRED